MPIGLCWHWLALFSRRVYPYILGLQLDHFFMPLSKVSVSRVAASQTPMGLALFFSCPSLRLTAQNPWAPHTLVLRSFVLLLRGAPFALRVTQSCQQGEEATLVRAAVEPHRRLAGNLDASGRRMLTSTCVASEVWYLRREAPRHGP